MKLLSAMAMQPGGGGVHTYCVELLAGLDRLGVGGVAVRARRDASQWVPASMKHEAQPDVTGARRVMASVAAASGAPSLVHGLDAELPRVGRGAGAKTVVTVHDLSAFDFAHHGSAAKARAAVKRRTTASAVERADVVIANSLQTAECVAERFGVAARVIYLAPRRDVGKVNEEIAAAVRARLGLPGLFALHVGSSDGRKRHDVAAGACRAAKLPLVTVGPTVTAPSARESGDGVPGPAVIHLGFVSAQVLSALYSMADAVLYLSDLEGFGLPAVEAMACGAIVVGNSTGALPELERKYPGALELSGPATLKSADAEEIGAAITRVLLDSDGMKRQSKAALAAAADMSWDKTAAATSAIYVELEAS
jgi:glycosyltransferase involved in cell wall biosynthesis